MFGISSFEFLVILLVALVVVGPEKMPGIIRRATRLLSDFRRVKTDFHRSVNLELANLELAEQSPKKQSAAEAALPEPAQTPEQTDDQAPAQPSDQSSTPPPDAEKGAPAPAPKDGHP